MDPLTIIVTGIAKGIAASAAKPAGGKIQKIVFGPEEEKALEKPIIAAIKRAVTEASDQGLSPEMAEHAASLFERLFLEQVRNDGGAVGRQEPEAVIRYWQRAAETAGLDLETFPVDFAQVVGRIIEHIPEELRREAARPHSPLYNMLTVEALCEIELQFAKVMDLSTAALSRSIPLSAPLQRTLDAARRDARATNCEFFTPHLLLALLRHPDSLAREAVDTVRRGLAKEIEEALSAYLASAKLGRYVDFDWRDRNDVRAAQLIAVRQGSSTITACHLLVAVLESGSNTQRQLVTWLGHDVVDDIKSVALTLRSLAARNTTPDITLPAAETHP